MKPEVTLFGHASFRQNHFDKLLLFPEFHKIGKIFTNWIRCFKSRNCVNRKFINAFMWNQNCNLFRIIFNWGCIFKVFWFNHKKVPIYQINSHFIKIFIYQINLFFKDWVIKKNNKMWYEYETNHTKSK